LHKIFIGKMRKNIRDILESWPKNFIRDIDFESLLDSTADARHSLIKRAFKSGLLIRIRQGLYLIASRTKQTLPDEFELALLIYQPSIISLESALSYHSWIPEAVYTITCVSPKRAQEFKTPIGIFSYKHVPEQGFYLGVQRIATKTGTIFIADAWRALADFMYVRRRSWEDLTSLEADLRIDRDIAIGSDKKLLKELSENYPSPRVQRGLKILLHEINRLHPDISMTDKPSKK